ncbi:MAG: hypothetical protein MI751_09010 [Pseudomonadales bacterium]|nr:hypothetical protein [Pseudomonadales bacterium]
MKQHMRGLLVGTLSAMLLGGCASANYYTEQGTPITQDTVALFNTNPKNPIIPYSKGKATFNAFSWASEDMQQRIEAKPDSSGTDELNIAATHWLHEGDMPPLDITITRHRPGFGGEGLVKAGTLLVTTFASVFSLGILPGVIPDKWDTTIEMRAGDELVYSANAHYRGTVFMSWIPYGKIRGNQAVVDAAWYASFFSHEEKLTARVYDEQPLYDRLKKSTDVDTLVAALDDPKLKFYRPLVSQHLAAVLAGQKRQDRLVAYGEIVDQHPEFVADIQGNDRLLFIGPSGQRVMDVLKQTYRKRSAPEVAASIRTAGAPYALFSTEEAGWLTSEGLPSDVVAAMIEVSEPGKPVASPGGQPGMSLAAVSAGAEPAQATGLEATASECTKAYAAKKVCENMPGDPFGLLMRGCMAQVKKKFGGMGCSIPF